MHRAISLPLAALAVIAAAPGNLSGIWMVETIDGKPPRYSGASIELSGGSLQATAGCNALSGSYTIEDGKLVAPSLIQTLMACENLMADESALGAVLRGSPTIAREGDKLRLTTTAHALTLRLRR
ncbi:heat shock protein HslJ [Novosphingobium kunmingense]|uniref:Heat shock protein HslJ n=1 Tax=Novosphingobium kunmingense TaxID=1211806 RepID=A0A2N0I3K4_9SPHN|nr:META domain-containing protein [Novosphingobium kunmingense]PKB25788.1 heat shock protein HslJ [Novosphingobium kunmingense]